MVETEQVHDRGLEIMDVDFVFDDAKSQFIGLAVIETGLSRPRPPSTS